MRRRLLTLVVLGAALLVGAALCSAPALADSGRSDTLVLRDLGHGKAALMRLSYVGTSLVPTTEWSGALPSGARLAAGSFDGAAADEALILVPRGKAGARLVLFSPAVLGYSSTTLWSTTRAGFIASSAKLVAADLGGSRRDELVLLVPSGAHGARLLGFSISGTRLSRTTLWSSSHAPFAIASAQLAAGDLTGSGKSDLLVFSQARTSAGLWGFRPSGTKLALHWHWSGHLPATTKLACGVPSGSSRFSALLASPTSSGKARLTTLRATSHSFAARRAWSGSLRLSDAQLSAVDLAGAGPVDLVVFARKGKTGATLTILTPRSGGYSAQVAWSVASGYQAARLACAPSLAGVLAPHAVSLPSSATGNLVAASPDLSTLTFSGGAPSGATVGSVLVGAPTTLAPQGILCRVTGVSGEAGRTTLSTTPASLDQAFSSLDVAYSHQLSVTDFAHLKLAKGVRLLAVHPARYGPLGMTLAPPSVTVAIDHDIDGLRLDGSLTLSERVDLNADITWLGGLRSASVTSTSTEDGSLTATASAGWSGKKEVTQYLGSWPIVIPTPLGFPIEITATLNLVVGAKASFEVGVTTGVTEHADFTIGASYANGHFTPIAKPGFTSHCTPPTLYGTADVKAYMGPQLLTTLYDVAGPSVGVDGYGEFKADTTADPWWTLHGGLEGSIGFEMQILSHVVASWNYSHTFYDYVAAQAPGGSTPPPTPSPSPTPNPTVTPTPAPTSSPTPGSGVWAAVSCGGGTTLGLMKNGTLWAWGGNSNGELGNGSSDYAAHPTPTEVGTDRNWAALSGGYDNTKALGKDGTLWAWGNNASGQLGLGTSGGWTDTLAQAGADTDWATVSSGVQITLALKKDGTLWAWGWNYYGQLGLGDTTDRDTPTEVGADSDWATVSCGNEYVLAVKTDGTLWAWGANGGGQLGLGTVDTDAHPTPTEVGTDSDWATVSCGGAQTLALKTDGTLWAWGDNSVGELGVGTIDTAAHSTPTEVGADSDWATVSCGNQSTLATKTDGTLWAWGDNLWAELGLGDTISRDIPTEVGTDSSWATVSCDDTSTLALKANGTLWAWGANDGGQLGLGDTSRERHRPRSQASRRESLISRGERSLSSSASATDTPHKGRRNARETSGTLADVMLTDESRVVLDAPSENRKGRSAPTLHQPQLASQDVVYEKVESRGAGLARWEP